MALLARKFVWRGEERVLKLEPPVWRCVELVAKSRGVDWRQWVSSILETAEEIGKEHTVSLAGLVRAGCFAALMADIEGRERAKELPDTLELVFGPFGQIDARLRLKGTEMVLGLHELNWLRSEIDGLYEKIQGEGVQKWHIQF